MITILKKGDKWFAKQRKIIMVDGRKMMEVTTAPLEPWQAIALRMKGVQFELRSES